MKKLLLPLLLFLLVETALPQQVFNSLELIKTIEVEGRQGVAVDSNYYYVSGSKAIFKYSKEGKLLLTNDNPFSSLTKEANHLGDIDYYNGKLYAGAEYFYDGSASNIQIVIYDAETLEFDSFFSWEPESGQQEVCAITVDPKNNLVWMADWIDGSYLYKYDLTNGTYIGKLHIYPVPEKQQGIKVYKNQILITADDGDAEYEESDHLYAVSILESESSSKVSLIKTFNDVKRQGEIEGLTIDGIENTLIVHFNRGMRVVNGMPIGFYPGYEKEIHELYIYKIVD
ncbi:MAG: hypothetical protein HND52_06715 [Ignavibacteriae bacterium]|nr:hypothetical protein [Ignavibacteriota bacterium]NOG97634.1 hypothetical protein [Ignavibacteriota bacterium]